MHEDLKASIETLKSAETRLKEFEGQLENQASTWAERSARAYELGDEDLAREALSRRSGCLRQRQVLLEKLSQTKDTRVILENELKEKITQDAKNTVVRITGEIYAIQQELGAAREAGNDLVAAILEEKIRSLVEQGREAWNVVVPGEAAFSEPFMEPFDVISHLKKATQEAADTINHLKNAAQVVDPYSPEIDAELQNLKRRMGKSVGWFTTSKLGGDTLPEPEKQERPRST